MDILIALVIIMMVATGAYVGYHASQEAPDAKGHGVPAPEAHRAPAAAHVPLAVIAHPDWQLP